jgi:signal transduction histidine kinase
MAEVLRLLRLSLILRIVIAVIAAVLTGMFVGNVPPVAPLTAVGSLALVVVISIALSKGKDDAKTVNRLLAAAILVQAVEAAILGLFFRSNLPPRGVRGPDPGGLPGEFPITSTLLLRGALGGALFMAIPAMLGSWVGGRRAVLRWTAFAVLANLTGDIIGLGLNWNALRFTLGSTLSQGVVVAILAYFAGSLADKMREEQDQLSQVNRQLQEQAHMREQLAASRERVRLSRDLHDTLAHTLAGLIVQLKAITTLLDRQPDAARRELAKAELAARQGLDETRAAIGDLRANMARDLGLSGALQRHVELMNERGMTQTTYRRIGEEPALSDAQGEGLFRIAQEALNNVQRHASASQAAVTLESAAGEHSRTAITIADNGIGFDLAALDDGRFGLRGMRERADELGAHLRVDSAAGKGTTVTVSLDGDRSADRAEPALTRSTEAA